MGTEKMCKNGHLLKRIMQAKAQGPRNLSSFATAGDRSDGTVQDEVGEKHDQ